MRKTLLLSAALLALSIGAQAQTADDAAATPATPGSTGAHKPRHPQAARHTGQGSAEIRPGHEPGVGESYPLSSKASNIAAGDTRSTIAPTLPAPAGGQNASVGTLLSDAQHALGTGQSGQAQEALERAETAMLQRSVAADQVGTPDQAPDVLQVQAAREALAKRDMAGAKKAIAAAMSAGK